MVTNYLIYLITLSDEKKLEEILMILIFLSLLSIILGFLYILKSRFINENKDSLFQRFLEKL